MPCLQSVLNTSSNLLADERQDSWTDLPQATQAKTATRMISSVEESAYQLADTYEQPAVVVNVTLNIGKYSLYIILSNCRMNNIMCLCVCACVRVCVCVCVCLLVKLTESIPASAKPKWFYEAGRFMLKVRSDDIGIRWVNSVI